MKKLLSLIVVLVAFVSLATAQTTCRIDGPANVRQSPSGSSKVMGSIRNGCIAEVSHAAGDWWYIHNVYSKDNRSAYSGYAIGYYTHRQNLIFNSSSKSSSGNSSNPFSILSSRVCSENDIYSLCNRGYSLRILRNAIYARHGYIFKSQDLKRYFSQYSWYNPRYSNVESSLSSIEKKNVQYIKFLEND